MNMRIVTLLCSVLPVACALGAAGCGSATGQDLDPIPVMPAALNLIYTLNNGLVTGQGAGNSWSGQETGLDPVIIEARRFYDTVQYPNAVEVMVDYPDPFTGAPPGLKKTAPLTLAAWKAAFGIPAQNPGESLTDYRARTGAVVYYNKNELGLGRELGCGTFDDGVDASGTKLTGISCFVTNYGTAFRDTHNSLRLATEGLLVKNTLCITYRPSLGPGYEVQFYVYNQNGVRREWAQLDTLGPRPLPQVCMNCHGGSYDEGKHLARFARFLPVDPNVVLWSDEPGLTRDDQEDRIRQVNALAMQSPLTPAQREMLTNLYSGNVNVPGTRSAKQWFPAAWNDTDAHRDLFDQVIKPNCGTCHFAAEKDPTDQTLAIYNLFQTPDTLRSAGLSDVVCNTFSMPISQATLQNLWEDKPDPIVLTDGSSYKSPSDILLAWMGLSRDTCPQLSSVATCNRGPSPDDLCGDAYSGQACNRVTGRCFPELGPYAPTSPTAPNGVCKTDGTRGCPFPLACTKRPDPIPAGLADFDGVCLPDIQTTR